jgi:adenylate cyclase, class 2
MIKYEKEVKILNINVKESRQKLNEIGATFKGEINQRIFTYDLPAIRYRFLDAKENIEKNNFPLSKVILGKLKTILIEVEDLLEEKELNEILNKFCIKTFTDILEFSSEKILDFINDETLLNEINKNMINPNKWIRLRENNEEVTLTVKHIIKKSKSNIQKVLECETIVDSIDDANSILNSLGIFSRNYQEKKRYSYEYKDAEIEIDLWPMIEPYIEIEFKDEKTLEEIIFKMNFDKHKIESVNTEELFRRKGINLKEIEELKF